MIALLIGFESVSRFASPVPIRFDEAIPIACLGLLINVASACGMLSGTDHGHSHGHSHGHGHGHAHPSQPRAPMRAGPSAAPLLAEGVQFEAAERPHSHAHRDNNLRAAVVHVIADAAVSVLVIAGLLLARCFGWRWTDPLAGIIGAGVSASWAYGLIRDTGAILLDVNPDRRMATQCARSSRRREIRSRTCTSGVWGPDISAPSCCVDTRTGRSADYYRATLARFSALSHLTIEVNSPGSRPSADQPRAHARTT